MSVSDLYFITWLNCHGVCVDNIKALKYSIHKRMRVNVVNVKLTISAVLFEHRRTCWSALVVVVRLWRSQLWSRQFWRSQNPPQTQGDDLELCSLILASDYLKNSTNFSITNICQCGWYSCFWAPINCSVWYGDNEMYNYSERDKG